jgi:HEAT repeat protein
MMGLAAVLLTAGCTASDPGVSDTELRRTATAYVEAGLRFPDIPAVRAQAMESATETLGDEALYQIRPGLKDEHPGVRFAACMAIGELEDRESIPQLRKLATDSDPNVRIGAFYALEKLGVTSYRRAWRDMLRYHDSAEVRRNAVLALGQLGEPEVLPLLRMAATTDQDEGVRIQAYEAMALLGDEHAIGRFIYEALGGVGFRQPFALLTLGEVPDERVIPALVTRLETSPYLEARLAAARSLGAHGYANGFELARKSLTWDDADPAAPNDSVRSQIMRVRSMAALALGEIGDRRALKPLSRLMQDPDDPRVQLAAATAILMILDGSEASSFASTGE